MLDGNKIITVTNRDSGTVSYRIPELNNLYRVYAAGESKQVTVDEIRKLSWMPGGSSLIEKCFLINDKEAIKEFCGEVEPEYFYTKEDIKNLLLNGSLDEFKDCLDFAPDGVVEIIKDLAVRLEVNDISKREAIMEKTNFNVSKAIEINRETQSETKQETKTRRVKAADAPHESEDAKPKRRTAAPAYKVKSMG